MNHLTMAIESQTLFYILLSFLFCVLISLSICIYQIGKLRGELTRYKEAILRYKKQVREIMSNGQHPPHSGDH